MTRKKKMEDSQIKGFRLPLDLIRRLEEAATLREIDLSEVVRAILQQGIASYIDQSKASRRQRLSRAVAAVQRVPALAPIFDKYKDKKNITLPLGKLDKAQLGLLIDAIRGYKELKELEKSPMTMLMEHCEQVEEEFGEERQEEFELLEAVQASHQEEGDRTLFGNLSDLLVEGRGLSIERAASGHVRFTFAESLTEQILDKDRTDQAIASVLDLLTIGLLRKEGVSDGGLTCLTRQTIPPS